MWGGRLGMCPETPTMGGGPRKQDEDQADNATVGLIDADSDRMLSLNKQYRVLHVKQDRCIIEIVPKRYAEAG